MAYPEKLQKLISFFEGLGEQEKRENLIAYSDNAKRHEPHEGETFVLQDIRKDEECADTVGVFLKVDGEGKAAFRMQLGPEVQTLTKAMTAILCKGLEGCTPQQVLDVPADFVEKIVGQTLVRVRSQTTYYVLSRMKGICQVYLGKERQRGCPA
jgi:cysteine desulfuration protein SufE